MSASMWAEMQQERDDAIAERDAARLERDAWAATAASLERLVASEREVYWATSAERDRLRSALDRVSGYVEHGPACDWWRGDHAEAFATGPCSCGLRAALAASDPPAPTTDAPGESTKDTHDG